MTKADFVNALIEKTGLLNKECAQSVESVFELMRASLETGEHVKISGFGVFEVKEKNERRGRNPQTGDKLEISGRRVLKFKASTLMKKRMGGL